MDAYNAGVLYLRNKFGYTRSNTLTLSGSNLLTKARNKKEKDIIFADENNYHIIPNDIPKDDIDSTMISLLLKQYSYGIAPKVEIEDKLYSLGVEFDWKYSSKPC